MFLSLPAQADVVKPALVEISVNTNGHYSVELRASIETLLTGINARYRNTKEAPNAQAYDDLRVLSAHDLRQQFKPFESQLTDSLKLWFDGKAVDLTVSQVIIPEPGYTKVPRISVIYLQGDIDRSVKTVRWYYPEAFGDNAVRVRQVDESNAKWHWSEWQWLRNDQQAQPFSLTEVFTKQDTGNVIKTYITAGYDHILPNGKDHILFILGIFLLSIRLRPLLEQVTMFTVAHSITLGLAISGYINLPSQVVEPLIALSIAYIGIENIFSKTLHKSRLFIVFAFGLLHGMSFASVLADFGMPDDAFLTALISFNVGVELGQLSIILLAFLAAGLWFRNKSWYRPVIVIPASAVIGIIGLYWTWDRLVLY
ncbi:MAG: HupE/UreJ family protein [gamma proteobacterium symbiont of Bathyaustriella thionipta]|nr:HupE/UreJ family protein [gamma proteobacterium symbiont of Bathyaustriella thionipta]